MALKLLRPLSGRINFLAIAAGAALLVLGFTMAPRLVALISLFDGRHAGIRISQPEAARLHEETARETRPQVVPKIIHQVFHNWRDPGNEKLPSDWDEMRKTCVDLNPGWDIKVGRRRLPTHVFQVSLPRSRATQESGVGKTETRPNQAHC